MPKVNMQTSLPVTAEEVWNLVGGFNALPEWHPAVERSELEEGGTVRRLHLAGGATIVERLEHADDGDRVYTYSIVDAPLPVRNYLATIRVHEDEDGKATVEWSSSFESDGVPETEAVQAIEGVYQAGLDNLKKLYGV